MIFLHYRGITRVLHYSNIGKKSIAELRRIYFRLREKVFCGQAPEERGRELEAFAVEIFGSTRRMVDVVDLTGPK